MPNDNFMEQISLESSRVSETLAPKWEKVFSWAVLISRKKREMCWPHTRASEPLTHLLSSKDQLFWQEAWEGTGGPKLMQEVY